MPIPTGKFYGQWTVEDSQNKVIAKAWESISLDSRFADLENPRVEYNLKLIVYFNYNHNYNYKNLVFFPYVYGGGHG